VKTHRVALTMFSSVLAVAVVLPVAWAHTEHHAAESAANAEAFGRPGVAKDASRSVAIHMTDAMRFDPASMAVKQGETLRLRIHNDGKLAHEFVLGTQAEIAEHAEMMRQMPGMVHTDAHSVRVAPGQSGEIVWNFSQAGKFLYACLIPGHWEAGMQGSVTVSPPVKR
jgi:uncharacterized cupredoxin-like copper-binding protein